VPADRSAPIVLSPVGPHVIIASDESQLDRWCHAWDGLATRAQRPYMTPAWNLAWWRHLRPRGAALRVVLIVDGDALIGVTPLYVAPMRRPVTYRMLGLPYDAPKQPLADPCDERLVAASTAGALVTADPPADALEVPALPTDGGWRDLLRTSGRGAHVYDAARHPIPIVPLSGSTFDAWFRAKSRNFRQQMRRAKRRLEEAGGRVGQAASAEEAASLIPSLIDLHQRRWRGRGGSTVVRPGLTEMLRAATSDLGVPERARIWFVEADGRIISAHLFVASGGRSSYWLGGFDDDWAGFHPAMLCLLAEVEHAFSSQQQLVDLGAGGHAYKQRLASDDELIARTTFVIRGRGYVRRRFLTAPRELEAALVSRTPESWRRVILGVRNRARDARTSLL
jgi:CelD/BcsL family acetyltransferase involved in cellulose biosynthesis